MKGTIEYFNPLRGYGFIRSDEQPKNEKPGYFFHVSSVMAGIPAVGREATFETGNSSKGRVALNVCVIVSGAVAGFTACGERSVGGGQ